MHLRRLPGLIYTHKYTLYSLITITGTLFYILIRWNLFCVNLQAWKHINHMCDQFTRKKRASGALCTPLCELSNVNTLTCHHSFRPTKSTIFTVRLRNSTELTVKTPFYDGSYYKIHWYDNGARKYPNDKEFLSSIESLVRKKLNIGHFTLVGGANFRYSGATHTDKDDIWNLMQDNEFMLLTVYGSQHNFFPRLLGHCGLYYAVQPLQPLHMADVMESQTMEAWARRVKVALMILEVLQDLHNVQKYHQVLEMCDMTIDNFGLSDRHQMKLVHLDHVYPRSVIGDLMAATPCTRDSDCDLLDCRAECVSGKCDGTTVNDNYQRVCERVFLGWRLRATVMVTGLLMSERTPSELAAILRQCASGGSRIDSEVKRRLVNVLTQMEQSFDYYL